VSRKRPDFAGPGQGEAQSPRPLPRVAETQFQFRFAVFGHADDGGQFNADLREGAARAQDPAAASCHGAGSQRGKDELPAVHFLEKMGPRISAEKISHDSPQIEP
jgi:hypothetical protein